MKCVMCSRSMDKAAAWVGAFPIGPKCLQKMGGRSLSDSVKVVRNDQRDLFGDGYDTTGKDQAPANQEARGYIG